MCVPASLTGYRTEYNRKAVNAYHFSSSGDDSLHCFHSKIRKIIYIYSVFCASSEAILARNGKHGVRIPCNNEPMCMYSMDFSYAISYAERDNLPGIFVSTRTGHTASRI